MGLKRTSRLVHNFMVFSALSMADNLKTIWQEASFQPSRGWKRRYINNVQPAKGKIKKKRRRMVKKSRITNRKRRKR